MIIGFFPIKLRTSTMGICDIFLWKVNHQRKQLLWHISMRRNIATLFHTGKLKSKTDLNTIQQSCF